MVKQSVQGGCDESAGASPLIIVFFRAEDGIRDAQESRWVGDVYKSQCDTLAERQDEGLGNSDPQEGIDSEESVPQGLSLIHI